MACTGHCNQCAAHPGYVGPATPVTWTDDPLTADLKIKEIHWDQLRDEIDNETDRRSETWAIGDGDPGNVSIGDKYYQGGTGLPDGWRELRNQLSYLDTGTYNGWQPADVDDTTILTGEQILPATPQAIRDRLDIVNQECICNCNYACTCNCNYPCTCNCNHTCLCDCNYSGGSK